MATAPVLPQFRSRAIVRAQIWLAVIVLPPALLLVFIMGLFAYMDATKTTLHPDLQQVRSVTHSDPSRRWTDAVERGRHIMRAGLTQQNLPGLVPETTKGQLEVSRCAVSHGV